MLKKVLAFTCLTLSIGVNAAALPFTYDFGFIGSEDGFSGAGSFTISTSENLTPSTDGLEAFEFTGLCAGYACSFDLADVTSAGVANWSVNEATGELSQLAISAYGYLSEAGADTRLFVGNMMKSIWTAGTRVNQVPSLATGVILIIGQRPTPESKPISL